MAKLNDRYNSYANHNYTSIDYDEKRGYYGTIQKPLYKLDMNTISAESVTLDSESDQTILTDVAIIDGSVVAGDYTLALGTLSESRNLVLTITDGDTSISAGTVTITGTDDDGTVITDSLDLSVGLTKTTANVYKKITNISVASLAGEGVGDKIKLVTAEIGLTGIFSVANNAAILSSNGSMVGNYFTAAYSNTSFSVATGTALDTEVFFEKRDSEAEILLDLGLGEYSIDYVNGLIYYKKKDSTTAITINYKYWDQAVTVEVGSVTIGNVVLHNSGGTEIGTVASPMYVKESTTGADVKTITGTTSSALDATTTINKEMELLAIVVTYDTAPVASENLIMSIDGATAGYDYVLKSVDPSLASGTDFEYTKERKLVVGDEIKLTYTNTNTRTIKYIIYYREL